MKASIPLYEGDSLIRFGGAFEFPPSRSGARAHSPWKAVSGSISRFFRWLEHGIERAHYRELERYLAGSADVCEVERRMREIEYRRGNSFDPYS